MQLPGYTERKERRCFGTTATNRLLSRLREARNNKKEMEKSQAGTFPQFLFVFRDDKLIGYMFLIAEKEKYCKAFPWWSVDNSDELPLDISIQLLEYGIQLSLDCNCPNSSNRLKLQLANQKNGIGRRPEHLCR